MNSAYMSRLCLTSSSRRTGRVEVFGCFDGAFSSAKCFSSFHYSPCITSRITICILRILHAGKTRSRFLRDGLERPHRNSDFRLGAHSFACEEVLAERVAFELSSEVFRQHDTDHRTV